VAVNYLISRKWSLADRFAITDPAGVEQFSAEGRLAFPRRLSVRDTAGAEAVITRRGLGNRYEIAAGGQLEARGNFTGRQYIITRAGSQAAAIKLRGAGT
jgi:uncharacterized protein YxjI